MKINLLTVALFLITQFVGTAQSSQKGWGFGVHPGVYSYFALQNGLFNGEEYGGGIELSIDGYLTKFFDLGIETGFGRVRHPLDASAISADQRDNLLTANISTKFKFDNGQILAQDFPVSPFIKVGAGVVSFGQLESWNLFIPMGLGIAIRIPKVPVNFVVQSSFNMGLDNNHFVHHSLGLRLNLGKKPGSKRVDGENSEGMGISSTTKGADRDYDGVPDEEDLCPDIHGSPLAKGCPDTDDDGVHDTEDKCPEQKGFANMLGCLDSDYDGIIDPDDKCPNEYGENMGCPHRSDPDDRDGDGVLNEADECPDVAGLFTAGGCPDKDGDGIKDLLDVCPDYYGVAEHYGCPIPKVEMDRLKKMFGDPDAPTYTINDKGQRVDLNGNPVDANNNIITDNGYNSNPYNHEFWTDNGTIIKINDNGNLIDKDGNNITYIGGYKIDEQGNVVDKNGSTIRIDNEGAIFNGNGDMISSSTLAKGGGINPNENPLRLGNNPLNLDPNTGGGGNPDPSGKGGRIKIGNPITDKDGGTYVTGWGANKKLSPKEIDYCQKIDLTQLRAAVYFGKGTANVNSSAYNSLQNIVTVMRKCALLELQIAGHTDSDGSDANNMSLSERRAKSVLRYVTRQGIDERRLKYNSYGERYPILPNTDEKNKRYNRRTEIRLQRAY